MDTYVIDVTESGLPVMHLLLLSIAWWNGTLTHFAPDKMAAKLYKINLNEILPLKIGYFNNF